MKFAKVLQQTLVEEDIPENWIEAAIQYKSLKKCINDIVHELERIGLGRLTLKLLINNPSKSKVCEILEADYTPDNAVAAEYSLMKSEDGKEKFESVLKIIIDCEEKDVVREQLLDFGGNLRSRLENLMKENSMIESISERPFYEFDEKKGLVSSHDPPPKIESLDPNREKDEENPKKRKLEILIKLRSDSKFFEMLNSEIELIDSLAHKEQNRIIDEVKSITEVLEKTTNPFAVRSKKSDLYAWRELFRMYLDSEVYFKYNETSVSKFERNNTQIKENLEAFVKRAAQSHITESFHNKQSLVAYHRFLEMNFNLLKIIQFQSINSEALRKILKKFDKQTSLNIKYKFPTLVHHDSVVLRSTSLAQSVCYIIQSSISSVVPQIDDYVCPICMSIAFRPIKLECGHIFCVRCLVKLKQQDKTSCPLCRKENAVSQADSTNLDKEKMQIMKNYFPEEVKVKMKEREKERYSEFVGDAKCVVM